MPILRQIAQLGHPVLRKTAEQIADPLDPAVQHLIDDLLTTVAEVDGVGIAAPQVYASHALFVVASRPNPRYPQAPLIKPFAVINPEVIWRSDNSEKGWEGCLSIPGIRALIPRQQKIGVRYLSRRGELVEEEYAGFLARIFQHEYDHLQGLVFFDRMESTLDLVTEKEYQRMMQ